MNETNNTDFIRTLKRKKSSHLAEINRLQSLVDSIDNLIRAYSNGNQQVTGNRLDLRETDTSVETDITKLALTEAIFKVMESNPGYAWRGVEIYNRLKEAGYNLSNLAQRVSSRLVERSRSSTGGIKRIEENGEAARYKLKRDK